MATETFGSITVISDVGATANSYVSVAVTKAQWDKNPNIDYSALTDEAIAQLVILATESLDLEYGADYAGTLYDEDYALFWPRVGVKDRRGVLITDYTVFPTDLQYATAAQAWWLGSVDLIGLEISGGSVSGVKSKNMDGLGGKEYFDVAEQLRASRRSSVSKDANKWLSAMVVGGTSAWVQIMQRG